MQHLTFRSLFLVSVGAMAFAGCAMDSAEPVPSDDTPKSGGLLPPAYLDDAAVDTSGPAGLHLTAPCDESIKFTDVKIGIKPKKDGTPRNWFEGLLTRCDAGGSVVDQAKVYYVLQQLPDDEFLANGGTLVLPSGVVNREVGIFEDDPTKYNNVWFQTNVTLALTPAGDGTSWTLTNTSSIDVSSEEAKRAALEGFESASSDDVGRVYDDRMGDLMDYFMAAAPSTLQ